MSLARVIVDSTNLDALCEQLMDEVLHLRLTVKVVWRLLGPGPGNETREGRALGPMLCRSDRRRWAGAFSLFLGWDSNVHKSF